MAKLSSAIVCTLLMALVLTGARNGAAGQSFETVYTPKPGSAVRKAIMDGLRATAEPLLHQKVIFVVSHLAVQGDWAFTITIPKQPNGKMVDWQKTQWRHAVRPGHDSSDGFSGEFIGLLRKRSGRWRAVAHCVGATNVCWYGWDKKYGAPDAIMHPK